MGGDASGAPAPNRSERWASLSAPFLAVPFESYPGRNGATLFGAVKQQGVGSGVLRLGVFIHTTRLFCAQGRGRAVGSGIKAAGLLITEGKGVNSVAAGWVKAREVGGICGGAKGGRWRGVKII